MLSPQTKLLPVTDNDSNTSSTTHSENQCGESNTAQLKTQDRCETEHILSKSGMRGDIQQEGGKVKKSEIKMLAEGWMCREQMKEENSKVWWEEAKSYLHAVK